MRVNASSWQASPSCPCTPDAACDTSQPALSSFSRSWRKNPQIRAGRRHSGTWGNADGLSRVRQRAPAARTSCRTCCSGTRKLAWVSSARASRDKNGSRPHLFQSGRRGAMHQQSDGCRMLGNGRIDACPSSGSVSSGSVSSGRLRSRRQQTPRPSRRERRVLPPSLASDSIQRFDRCRSMRRRVPCPSHRDR